MVEPAGAGKTDERRNIIIARVLAGGCHRNGIDVGGDHLRPPQFGGGDGEHSRAATDVQNPREPPPFREAAERVQAQCGGFMMTCAESQTRFDANGNDAKGNHAHIVRAVQSAAVAMRATAEEST